ncbi:hypothetical protein S7335_405 [Synechococcus sp. PCC 7335]|nr:hypothetical protein S7335_405 [Synechococcus sp. PCC 7335]
MSPLSSAFLRLIESVIRVVGTLRVTSLAVPAGLCLRHLN